MPIIKILLHPELVRRIDWRGGEARLLSEGYGIDIKSIRPIKFDGVIKYFRFRIRSHLSNRGVIEVFRSRGYFTDQKDFMDFHPNKKDE